MYNSKVIITLSSKISYFFHNWKKKKKVSVIQKYMWATNYYENVL